MKPFLSVYGSVSIDWIMTLDEFPELNTSVNLTSKIRSLGGTASNIAATASSLGVPTALCAFVGDDFPIEYEKELKSLGMNMDEFVRVKGHQSSVAHVISNKRLEQKVLFYPGPHNYASKLKIQLTKNAMDSKYVHFCTGEPKYHIDIMKIIKGRNIAMDPAQEIHQLWGDDNFNEAFGLSNMLFCNRHEARSILKYLHRESFNNIDFPFVLCTKGEEGSELYLDGKRIDIPAVKADKVVDVTGAGDAFRAGFYAGLYRKMDIVDSLIVGASTASFVVEKVGAISNIPTWDKVMERADKILSKV